jgi:hypothetical protein
MLGFDQQTERRASFISHQISESDPNGMLSPERRCSIRPLILWWAGQLPARSCTRKAARPARARGASARTGSTVVLGPMSLGARVVSALTAAHAARRPLGPPALAALKHTSKGSVVENAMVGGRRTYGLGPIVPQVEGGNT